MRVLVDFERCESNAVCMSIAPLVFEVGEDDRLRVLDSQPPDELEPAVVEAAAHCPTRAIAIVND